MTTLALHCKPSLTGMKSRLKLRTLAVPIELSLTAVKSRWLLCSLARLLELSLEGGEWKLEELRMFDEVH